MRRVFNTSSVLYFIWSLTILSFIFGGKIVFGQGIGDMFYLILLLVLQIIFGYVFFLNIKNKVALPKIKLVTILLIVFVLLFTLKMTIYRGMEYPWNGNFFFE